MKPQHKCILGAALIPSPLCFICTAKEISNRYHEVAQKQQIKLSYHLQHLEKEDIGIHHYDLMDCSELYSGNISSMA